LSYGPKAIVLQIILWTRPAPDRQRRIVDFEFPRGDVGVGESIMAPFEKMCLGSALTGFVVLVVTTLMMFVAA
jgi:hypothetical protein